MGSIDFSVIVPCFNSEATILRTLSSIAQQDYDLKKVELLVVDDCSTDSTASLIQGFSESSKFGLVHFLRTDINLGPGIARNKGLEMSNGQYIMFVDSDDSLNPMALKTIYGVSTNHADIIYFDGLLFSNEISILCKHLRMSNTSDFEKAVAILNLETDEHVIFAAYRREFILNLPKFTSGVYEDVPFSGWAFLKSQNVDHLPTALLNKFATPGQITETMTADKALQYLRARLEISNKIMSYLPDNWQDLKFYYESGLRGSVAVSLKKLERSSKNHVDFATGLNKIFNFLRGQVDNFESVLLNPPQTAKDIDTLRYYLDWKKSV